MAEQVSRISSVSAATQGYVNYSWRGDKMSEPEAVPAAAGGAAPGPCQVCQKEMQFIMPTPRIFNEIDVSCIVMAHPPSRCPHCQAIHLPLIKGISEEGIFQ